MAVYNFCIVGVVSIFWAQGIPTFVTQGYLVATSVILAWQLAHFDACTWNMQFCSCLAATLVHSTILHASDLLTHQPSNSCSFYRDGMVSAIHAGNL